MADLTTTITTAGYVAAANNSPDRNGYRIELKYCDIYSNGVKKGRFPVAGVRVGGNQVRVRATITSEREEYSYHEVRLIDGISNVEFAIIKRTDGGVMDYVSPYKKSTFSYNITFSTIAANRITITHDNNSTAALAELDAHKTDANAHKALFDKKADKTELQNLSNRRASTTQTGLVQLSDEITTDQTKAATPHAVKAAIGIAIDELTGKYNRLTRDAVLLTGVQNIEGGKNFHSSASFKNGVFVSDDQPRFNAQQYLALGANAQAGYIRNQKSNKTLTLKHDGTLEYDGAEIITASTNQTLTGEKKIHNNLWVTASTTHANANRWLRIGADGTGAYVTNHGQNKVLYLRHDGTLTYDNKRVLLETDNAVIRRSNFTATKTTENPRWHGGVTSKITGEVVKYPDGRIEQYIHVQGTGGLMYSIVNNGWEAHFNLWEPFPNRMLWATLQFSSTDTAPFANTSFSIEAGEWSSGWLKHKSTNSKVVFGIRRIGGGDDELMDFVIKVEGY